jgi:hypothetical protein
VPTTYITEQESATAITTLDRVKELIFGQDAAAVQTYDPVICRLIDEVSAFIEAFVGKTYRHADTDITEYHDIDDEGQRDLYLDVRPITSITHIYEDSGRDYADASELTAADDDFILYAADGFVRRVGCWEVGDQSIKVVYKGGYITARSVPANIAGTAAAICAFFWKQFHDGGDRLGISSLSKGDGSIQGFAQKLPPFLLAELELLRSGASLGIG